MASPQEAGPLVVIEAWLAGVPVVSTPVGLVQEYPAWVAHVAQHDDVDAFADSVRNVRIAMQRTDYPSHIARIAKQAASEFSLPAFAARWEKFITELVGNQRVNSDQRLSESSVRAAGPAACENGDDHVDTKGKGATELGTEGIGLHETAA